MRTARFQRRFWRRSFSNRLKIVMVALLTALLLTIFPLKSSAAADHAEIYFVSSSEQTRIDPDRIPALGEKLYNQLQALWIAAGGHYAHIALRQDDGTPSPDGPYVRAESDIGGNVLYRFPCKIEGGINTVGYERESAPRSAPLKCEYPSPTAPTAQLLSRLKHWKITARSIFTKDSEDNLYLSQRSNSSVMVAPATDDAILYQARYREDTIVIDVVNGIVLVETPEDAIRVEAGNSFIYQFFSGISGQQSQGINPDQTAIDDFLEPDSWPSIESEIRNLRQDLRLTGTETLSQQAQEFLDLHNQYRDEVQIPRLTWSNELANSAQAWADELAASGGPPRHPVGTEGSGMGENVWGGTAGAFSLTQMIDSWGSEKRFFQNGRFPDVSSTGSWQDVGHYSQMVWRRTNQLGCGLATGSGRDYLVCRYSPPGNVIGQPVF